MRLLLLLLASYLQLLHALPFLGISPQDEKYYLDGAVIFCKDGSKSFPRSRLNDNFCDCADGTDEPGTSACPESKFYCRNAGDTPRVLFSSRVNDDICDCCDGSDEYDGATVCPNTCNKDGNDLDIRSDHLDLPKLGDSKENHVSEQKGISRVDLEDLIQNLKGFRVAIIVQLVSLICILALCQFYRRNRMRRRRSSLRIEG